MVQNIHLMMRMTYTRSLKALRALPPEEATVLRQAGLLLVAHDVLATFHRAPTAVAIGIRVDYSPEDPDDQYDVSARNGFFDIHGDETPPYEHGLKDKNMPLELMSTGSFTVKRDDPLVQLSLSEDGARDRLLHHRIVHQLAVELDIAFPFP